MKSKLVLLFFTLYLIGCASYKELKPKPELAPAEQGYIELKNDDKNFKLKDGKKYFISFPAPALENFYLVLDISNKSAINSYLTNTFDDGKGRIIEIKDESEEPDRLSVFPVENSVQKFYWVIDLVKEKVELDVDYRYVPRWRFKFENKYASFKESFNANQVDRQAYESIGSTLDLDNFNYSSEIQETKNKTAALKGINQELLEIESIFPVNIVNTKDEAYQNYRDLKSNLNDELAFQADYFSLMQLLQNEQNSRGSSTAFVDLVPDFNRFFENKDKYASNVLGEVRSILGKRLPEVVPFYKQQLLAKNNANRFDSRIDAISKLYPVAGMLVPSEFTQLSLFVKNYNQKVDQVSTSKKKLKEITDYIANYKQMPSNTFFSEVLTRLSKLQYQLPKAGGSALSTYGQINCVKILNKEIYSLNTKVNTLLNQYRQADSLVPQINALKAKKNYRGMLGLLKQNRDLGFLLDMYKGIDQLSLNEQSSKIKAAMAAQNWSGAEQALQTLHLDSNFLNPQIIKPKKKQLVRTLEDSLASRIQTVSKQRARQFMAENINTLDNVDDLYANPVFLPVHEMTFTSGRQADLSKRNKRLYDQLNTVKEQEFPSKAISQLYTEFAKNPNADGVLRARAIVSHAKYYKGTDKKIKNRVAECDPWASKWITKAKDYRKVFALPTTSNNSGSNTYVFRLNVRIPTEAKFPVYDVNIRLPKEVAKDASATQWYEKIMLNKKILKNEGRFTITAPSALNDYECQITPVRMNKEGDNVLEVHFKHNSFKVFEVSVMAQKPIIKKH